MTKTQQNIEFWTGEDKFFLYDILDNTGASVLVTSFTGEWHLRDEPDGASLLHYITGGSGVTLSGCTMTVTLAASDTAGCSMDGTYYATLSGSDGSGNAQLLAWGWAKVHYRPPS